MTVEIILSKTKELDPISSVMMCKRRKIEAQHVGVYPKGHLYVIRDGMIMLSFSASHRNILYVYVTGN